MNLKALQSEWSDTEEYHKHINDLFCDLVNFNSTLRGHRNFVENGYGFGERAFWNLWKIICDEQPKEFSFLEIGCYKGATISLIKLLRPDAKVYTVTPLTAEGGYGDDDYANDVITIHNHFGLNQPVIIQGLSTNDWVIQSVKNLGDFNVIYVDGGHDTETVIADLDNYAPMVKIGGLLVMDDANSDMHMPHGYFQGHKSVTDAKLKWLETQTDFVFVFSCVHISVFRRIK